MSATEEPPAAATGGGQRPRGPSPSAVLLVGATLALTSAVLVSAWVSDDALITLRTIDHFLHGRGLRFNPLERVQAFTHPLWLLWMTPFQALTGEGLLAPIAAGVVCTAGAVALAIRSVGARSASAWVVVLALASSKSFVDYATSGLENPLTHLLLAAFALVWLNPAPGDDAAPQPSRRDGFALTLIAALVFTNRMDAVLLVAPAGAWLAARAVRSGRLAEMGPGVVAGLGPALLWVAFAWLYFGSPLPNTAFSKLSTGIDRGALVAQGLVYLRVFLDLDMAGALVLLAGTGVGLSSARSEVRALAIGVPSYVAYTVWIGGDFMAGRFFTAPVFVAAILLGVGARDARPAWQSPFGPAIAVAAAILAAVSPVSPLRVSPQDDYETVYGSRRIPEHGIVDERVWYYASTGAFSPRRDAGLVPGAACEGEGRVRLRRVCGDLGRVGFEGCVDDHWIDPCGLTDAFLAQRPVPTGAAWRIGHFMRTVPPGYARSIAAGRAMMNDASLDAAFERTLLRVRAPLFRPDRLREIALHPFGGPPIMPRADQDSAQEQRRGSP